MHIFTGTAAGIHLHFQQYFAGFMGAGDRRLGKSEDSNIWCQSLVTDRIGFRV